MKANLAPEHIRNINDCFILWFKESNRYVVVSKDAWLLINLFLETNNAKTFIDNLQHTLLLGSPETCNGIFEEISTFLYEANLTLQQDNSNFKTEVVPLLDIERYYKFKSIIIKINYASTLIESIIHPQIAHKLIKDSTTFDTEFDVFKTGDYLHLNKNKELVGSFKTENFHLLQGRFALELTNTIHNKNNENWIATFHASTVANSKNAMMLIGDSGNGKSTLSALLMANGFDLIADDFTPMYEDLELYRYPSAISIKKGAFELLESHIPSFNSLETYFNGPKKVNLKYVPNYHEIKNSSSHLPCKTIVYVKYDKTKKSELNPISVEKILETLIPDSWISPNPKHAQQFLNWLETVKFYELCYSDNQFAIESLKNQINS
nr:hypothetical protein [uncultured Psychroserpens sp.]